MELKSYHREYSDAEFKAWLENQNPETEYDYLDTSNCVYAQFLKSKGIERPVVGPYSWCEEMDDKTRTESFKFSSSVDGAAYPDSSSTPKETHGNTFGKALERLNYLLEQEKLETVTT